MSERDLELDDLSALIGLVYDSAFEGAQWQSLMARIPELCPGHVAAVMSFDMDHLLDSYITEGATADELQDVQTMLARLARDPEHYEKDMILVMLARQKQTLGEIVYSRALYSEEEFRDFAAYKQQLEPLGLGHWTAINYSMSDGRRAAFVIAENERDPRPKDNARLQRILKLLAPHAVRAARLARALNLAKEAAETYAGFIDAIALPMMITDGEGRLQMANASGQRLLERGRILRLDAGSRVHFANDRDLAAFRRHLRETGEDMSPRGMRFDAGEGRIALCIAPFHPAMTRGTPTDRDLYDRQSLFAVFVGAPADATISTELLRNVFELTPREAEICSALASGQSPQQIAEKTGRAEKTIRNQIQAVHDKVGVTSNRALGEALSVFQTVGAMFDAEPPGNGDAPRLPGRA